MNDEELTRGQKAARTRKRNKAKAEREAQAVNDERAARFDAPAEPAEPKRRGRPRRRRVSEAAPVAVGDATAQIAAVIKSREARIEGELARLKAARSALEDE